MTAIRILADDLTGALDSAAAFRGDLPVFIGTPPAPGQAFYDAAVSVVATHSRDIDPGELEDHLTPAAAWLRDATIAFKKVDSLLRGNSFAEPAWLMQQGDYERMVFAPAFPAQGRLTRNDRQWRRRNDQTAEVISPPLKQLFADLKLDAGPEPDRTIWIPSIETDSDLDQVAEQVIRHFPARTLWCGSAGLAHALSRQQGLAGETGQARPQNKDQGPTVLISASFQTVIREQWTRLATQQPRPVMAEQANAARIGQALQQVRQGARVVCFDLSPRETLSREAAAASLSLLVAQLTDSLPRPGQLMVVGGDTLMEICHQTRASGLLAKASIKEGWGCARLIGGKWDGVPCYSRSGAFGDPDDLLTMVQLLDRN
jgi:uncharacterized protein YgbK (DUF1537 family)